MRALSVALVALVICGCTPPALHAPAAVSHPAAAGVGVCHWIAREGLPDEVDFGTETTVAVHWRNLEPLPGVYNWGAFDEYVRQREGGPVGLWLAVQTVDAGMDGQPKAPRWLMEMGAVWHTGACSKGGMFAPWDGIYVERLRLFLTAVNAHIMGQPAAYRGAIAGIVIMSGGMYGEYQLGSCNMYEALQAYYGYERSWEFDDDYYNAVRDVVRVYAEAFPTWPLMLQVGTPPNDHAVINWFVRQYRERAYVKWAGWGPDNVGDGKDDVRREANERYGTLFRFYRINANIPAHFGFEPGHPVQEWLGPAQYLSAMRAAVEAGVSYVCFQAGTTLWMAYDQPWFTVFDAELEANAAGSTSTPTALPTATVAARPTGTLTPTITGTPTSTRTRTATPTLTPIASPTPTSMSKRTPTATAEMIWLCECKPVTVTPGP